MKPALLIIFLLSSPPLRAEETPTPTPEPATASSQSSQSLLALCPKDMPPACACVAQGDGVRVMPANEAYKSRKNVLLVGPSS